MKSHGFAAWCLAAVNLVGVFWFILGFEESLHCTQVTSYRVAVFEMVPHVEERIERDGPLPAYTHPTAVPIRAIVALVVPVILAAPPIALLAVLLGRLRKRTATVLSIAIWLIGLAVSFADSLLGERLTALIDFALLFAILFSPAFALGLAFSLHNPKHRSSGNPDIMVNV